MKKIEIFDPAMCCDTGICGPAIDPELLRIATVISGLKEKGINIKRYGLANEPQKFISNKTIGDLLQTEGAEVLPVTIIDGEVAKKKEYPTNEELSTWLGVEIKTKQTTKEKEEDGCCCCEPNGCC